MYGLCVCVYVCTYVCVCVHHVMPGTSLFIRGCLGTELVESHEDKFGG